MIREIKRTLFIEIIIIIAKILKVPLSDEQVEKMKARIRMKGGIECVFCGRVIAETEDMNKTIDALARENNLLEIKLLRGGEEIVSGYVCGRCENVSRTIGGICRVYA